MFGLIIGKVRAINANTVTLLTKSDIGYNIHITNIDLIDIRKHINEDIALWIYTDQKDGITALYGFLHIENKLWFEALIGVSGIGCKIAISILSSIPIPILSSSIMTQDCSKIQQVPGIGAKIATRAINELNKMPAKISKILLQYELFDDCGQVRLENPDHHDIISSTAMDAIDALTKLGFGYRSALSAVSKEMIDNNQHTVESLISAVLPNMRSE